MKNQYVGDVNDYRKYGLIRALCGEDKDALRLGVLWLLTPDDKRNDGNILGYLDRPEQWRDYDQPLFDQLHSIVHKHYRRTVSLVQDINILSGSSFAANLIPDDKITRNEIISSAFKSFAGCDLIFFDPDNGLEVKSRPLGRKDSNKYLYYSETTDAFNRGHSLLIYQHFPRINRTEYISLRSIELIEATGASNIFSFSTKFVCFFLVPQQRHIPLFNQRIEIVREKWANQFDINVHSAKA